MTVKFSSVQFRYCFVLCKQAYIQYKKGCAKRKLISSLIPMKILYTINKYRRRKKKDSWDNMQGIYKKYNMWQHYFKIYKAGVIPYDFTKSIFNSVPKKGRSNRMTKCENNRTICFMSRITKIFLRLLVKRMWNRIRAEVARGQCGFVEGKGPVHLMSYLY